MSEQIEPAPPLPDPVDAPQIVACICGWEGQTYSEGERHMAAVKSGRHEIAVLVTCSPCGEGIHPGEASSDPLGRPICSQCAFQGLAPPVAVSPTHREAPQ